MRVWKTGERCRIKCGGRTVDGVVELAAQTGVSLAVTYEGILDPGGGAGGYPGGMMIMWNGSDFQDLAGRGVVELEPRE